MPKKQPPFVPPSVILTPQGRKKLEAELSYLKSDKRPAIIKKIASAKELGDLSENAEYADAKNEQAFNESRIAEIEAILKYGVVVKPDENSDTVVVGATVTLKAASEIYKYTLVGLSEADPASGKISHDSPLGRALIGKRISDVIRFETPRGSRELTVLSVVYEKA